MLGPQLWLLCSPKNIISKNILLVIITCQINFWQDLKIFDQFLLTGFSMTIFLAAGVSDGTQKLGSCLSFPLTMLETDDDDDELALDDPATNKTFFKTRWRIHLNVYIFYFYFNYNRRKTYILTPYITHTFVTSVQK